MEVRIAGYNIDSDLIESIRKGECVNGDIESLTPEVISAAYARISRSPLSVTELRQQARADVAKARRSNVNIVFDMGHSSISEHACVNIDVIGVSRLLTEHIERFRLCSYTEKSQRYVLFSENFSVPEELTAAGLGDEFRRIVKKQFEGYAKLYEILRKYYFKKYSELAQDPKKHSTIEGYAKEDARYVLSLATETQLGMTVNARNLELMIRRMLGSSLSEAREFGSLLRDSAHALLPSLVRYVTPTKYETDTKYYLREHINEVLRKNPVPYVPWDEFRTNDNNVYQVDMPTDADNRLIAALIHTNSGLSFDSCERIARSLAFEEKREIVKKALEFQDMHDSAPREFESVYGQFEITLSASSFAQFKRHRVLTLLAQDYDVSLGVEIPDSVIETGSADIFLALTDAAGQAFVKWKKVVSDASGYVLTNAHRRRVFIGVNARELYHIARLRLDRHAQWAIRRLCDELLRKAKEYMPLTLLMATGKDSFDQRKKEVYRDEE